MKDSKETAIDCTILNFLLCKYFWTKLLQTDQRVENAARVFCSFPAAGSKLHSHNELLFKAPWEVSCTNLEEGN